MDSSTLDEDVELLLSGADTAAAKAKVFQEIKPMCTQLLFQRSDPQQLTQLLAQLTAAVQAANHVGLRACYDYTVYPLLFMLESVAASRAPASSSRSGDGDSSGVPTSSSSMGRMTVTIPAMKNDRAAEAVMGCTLVLLQRVGLLQQDQVIAVLQPVAALLTLPPGATTEEMRLQALRVITASVQPSLQQQSPRRYLQDQSVAPLAGVLISGCFAAAEHEVAAAGAGSKAVRHAAVQALQAVVLSVGPGGQLAYFLPGLASGLMKQIMAAVPPAAGLPVTGAASSSSTTVLLLQLMARVFTMTVGDMVIQHIPGSSSSTSSTSSQQQPQQQVGLLINSSSVSNAEDTLAVLQQLSLQASHASSAANTATLHAVLSDSSTSSSRASLQQQQQGTGGHATTPSGTIFTVKQDHAWLEATSSKVQTILAVTLPRLLCHPQHVVRQAVAAAAADLAMNASRVLWNSRQALLEILLTLANDDYQQISDVAVAALQQESAGVTSAGTSRVISAGVTTGPGAGADNAGSTAVAAASTGSRASASMVGDLLVSLCLGLPGSVKQGGATAIAAAKRAAAAILCAGPSTLTAMVFSKPAVLQQVCQAMVETFQLDPSSSALLLRAQAGLAGGEVTAAAEGSGSTLGSTSGTGSRTAVSNDGSAAGSAPSGVTAAAAAAAVAKVQAGAGHPLLPRMPLSLQHLINFESYKAAAGVARALGRAARLADVQRTGSSGSSSASTSLQLLVDELLEQIAVASSPHKQQNQQQQQQSPVAAVNRLLTPAKPAAGEWQCQTAAAVVVLTELLFGASAAWTAPISSSSARASSTSARGSSGSSGDSIQQQQQWEQVPWMDSSYESVLLRVLNAVTQQKLWGLPTSLPAAADTAAAAGGEQSSQQKLPAQVLGANALLLRCLIDWVGTAARCSARHFSSNTKLLRAALLPLLERLADPCPLVAAAAGTSLASICRHSGYQLGLGQLVGANADYVVDGVCKRLRSLQQNPRAPQLLAVLLKEAGVGAQLLPLLAEPLRAALSGLSILARKQQPGYTVPFLNILQSVAAGAAAEAAASQAVFKSQVQQCIAAATAAGLFDADQDDLADSADTDVVDTDADADVLQQGTDALISNASGADTASGDTAAARYFRQRLQRKTAEANGSAPNSQPKQKQQRQEQLEQDAAAAFVSAAAGIATSGAAMSADMDSVPALSDLHKLHLPAAQIEQLELAWRRAYSAAGLASSAVDAATPLLLQRNLRNAVLAASVLAASLEALAAATDAIDTEEKLFEQLVDRGADVALKPVRPTPAKLLPAVHAIWAPLLAALQDTGSVALLEQGLSLLCKMVRLAGGKFMSRRFKQEAWPLLQRLLKHGPQSGATALAVAAAASSTGGGAAAAALLGIGGGPGSEYASSRNRTLGGGSVLQSALRSLEAASSSSSSSTWNEAQQGMVAAGSRQLQDDHAPLAPAAVQRVQVAVLACLQGICSDSAAAPAMQGSLVWDACMLAAPYLADSKPLALREAAAKLLMAAAQVDADAVWLVLVDAGSCYQDVAQLLASATNVVGSENADSNADTVECIGILSSSSSAAAAARLAAAVLASVGAADADSRGSDSLQGASHALPKLQQLLPSVSSAGPSVAAGDGDQSGLQGLLRSRDSTSCGKRAAALLPRAAQVDVAWHAQAEQQLAQLQSAKVL